MLEHKFSKLKVEKRLDGSVWLIFMTNPPANTLAIKTLEELSLIIDDFEMSKNARVLILTGEGDRAFCAGADINEISKVNTPELGEKLAREGLNVCDKIESVSKPIIAAINAMCIGGGNEIAMACHMRIASDKAKFSQPEITIGIIPGFGGTQRLPRLIGESRARQMILTGDIISAQKAYEFGLVDEVVKHGKVIECTLEMAKRIIKNSQLMVECSQKAIREGNNTSLKQGLEIELKYFKEVCSFEDMREGVNAFKERRKPNFKNK